MKCVNCEKEIQAGIDKCPHCGCQYPKRQYLAPEPISSPQDIDQSEAGKEIKMLIDMAVSKGNVTSKERSVILRTAEKYGLDKDIAEMMLDAALAKAVKDAAVQNAKSTIPSEPVQQNPVQAPKQESAQTPQKQQTKVVPKVVTQRFCRKCGNPIKSGARFCNKCGTSIL